MSVYLHQVSAISQWAYFFHFKTEQSEKNHTDIRPKKIPKKLRNVDIKKKNCMEEIEEIEAECNVYKVGWFITQENIMQL